MNAIFTLDYELFLGSETGTPQKCLIESLNLLLHSTDPYNVKYVIFVDAAYLLRLKQLSSFSALKSDYELVTKHIKDLNEQGHDIQLHFHPQWLYSTWDDGKRKWNLDHEHYKLSDIDDRDVFEVFHEAKSLLDTIIGQKTYAFRAGGFCLPTFEKLPLLFDQNDIYIDSSVCRGDVRDSNLRKYDYSNLPNDVIYRFDTDIVKEDLKGNYLELTISNMKLSYICHIFKWKFNKQIFHQIGDGIGIGGGVEVSNLPQMGYIRRLFHTTNKVASIDGNASSHLIDFYKEASKKQQSNFVLLGHPKFLSPESIKNIVDFIESVKDKVTFITTKQVKINYPQLNK